MGNIFENAYFGKPYKTNTEEKAIYLGEDLGDFKYRLAYQIISDISNRSIYIILECDEAGCSKTDIDIVSEWKEEIDEEKLDRIADDHNSYIDITYPTEDEVGRRFGFNEGFKIGYHIAKEE